jgi:sirohydrochlorin cobaltochelatase
MPGSLVLVGHGSHLNGNSSAPVRAHAAALSASGDFDEVHVGFWKEEPSLSRVLDVCESDDVVVVPIFISNGYFTEEVIPREMRLTGRISTVDGKRVTYSAPVGTHPSLADIIIQRAEESGAAKSDALVVLGHGTPRNAKSSVNVYRQARFVAAKRPDSEVVTAFMDQEPNLRNVFSIVRSDSAVMVPLFVSDGWHVSQTIPEGLELEGATRRQDGRSLRFSGAVGTHPSVPDVVRELVAEADSW